MNSINRRNELVTCPTCRGEGELVWDFGHSHGICYTCGGSGRITLEKKIRRELSFETHSQRVIDAMVEDYFNQ